MTSTTVAWPFSDFFQNFSNCLKRPKNVVWQSADGRVTPTTVAWPFSDFFQNFPKSLETSKKRCLTVGRRSRDLRPLSRDRSATFFKFFSNFLKRPKNVVWQSADGRVTSTTVAWPFSDFFQNFPKSLETSKKRCLTVGRRSRDLRTLSRDSSATFFKKFPYRLKRPKTLFDSCPTVAWPPTTVAWPFSDFFQNFSKLLQTSKNVVLTVGRRSRDLRSLSRDSGYFLPCLFRTAFAYASVCCLSRLNLVLQWSCLQQDQDFGLDLEARPMLSHAGIETKTKTSVVKSQVETKTLTKQIRAVLIFKTMVSRQQDCLILIFWFLSYF